MAVLLVLYILRLNAHLQKPLKLRKLVIIVLTEFCSNWFPWPYFSSRILQVVKFSLV